MKIQPLSQIKEHHRKEWVIDSGVDPKITALNIVSLQDEEPYEYLLYNLPEKERRNTGALRTKHLQRYRHVEQGGWWCSGVDLLTGEDSIWGTLKPDVPYRYQEEFKGFDSTSQPKNKVIKYEHPPKTETEIFALKVPLNIWRAIANRYQVSLPENIIVTSEGRAFGFWAWVLAHPEIPVLITEGAKKAGVLLTANYVAIALPGIYNGYRQPKDDRGNKIGNPKLIPQLEVFAQQGREIVFCYDHDEKPKTIKNVRTAIAKTGRLFAEKGCKVSVVTWNFPEKGVDDLIVARGQDCFDTLYKARIPLSRFKLRSILDLSKYKPFRLNERYLSDNLVIPEDAQIIGLRSPKGTGKTQWLSNQVQKAIRQGKRAIVVTHRIQLAKALCERFGIDHIEDIRDSETRGVLGYGLCIDSLHPNSQAHFNPEEWEEAVVILDECEQVIWHMLDSTTCQSNRVAIIENFQKLITTVLSTGGKIYLSDADLSAIAIDYIREYIPTVTEIPVRILVVENVYQRSLKRKLFSYSGNDPSRLISALVQAIKQGEKVLIHTTGQKAESHYGSTNLEAYLKKQFPDLRILRIDAKSVADPNHPAYRCMRNLNAILQNYDLAIASPVIETGVSIDIENHFDSVWAIAYGVQTVDAVCQTLERLRADVPRHIWVNNTAKGNRIGNGSTSVRALLRSQHKLTKANIDLLHQAGITEFDDLEVNFSPESLITWAKLACMINSGKNNYREEVIYKLLSEGYELEEEKDKDSPDSKIVKKKIKETCDENYKNYCQVVSKAEMPAASQLKELKKKKSKTNDDRYQKRKGELAECYGVEVNPELVGKDDNGWHSQLQLHYYLTQGKPHLVERDRRSLKQLKDRGQGKVFKPDLNNKQLLAKIRALELIEITQFLDPDSKFTKDSLKEWFEKILKLRYNIRAILGVSIHPKNDTAIAVAQRLLKKLGLSLERQPQIRINGKPTRFYHGCNPDPDGRSQVFDYWLKRDSSQSTVTPFSIKDINYNRGDTAA